MGCSMDFERAGPPVHYIWRILPVVTTGDRAPPGIGSLPHSFQTVKGEVKRKTFESSAFY